MTSTPRTASNIIKDLEQRLKYLTENHIHDTQTLNDLESLLNECSNQLNQLVSTTDSTFISIVLPSLLQIIIVLSKKLAEKSDLLVIGPYLSRDKILPLITLAKSLHNQVKEFIKLPKLNTILSKSTNQQQFCEQLRVVSDSVAGIDPITTLICQKLIVKLLTDTEDESESSLNKIQDTNYGLIIAVYNSVLKHMSTICSRHLSGKLDLAPESPTLKMFGLYFQMISKLILLNNTLSRIETYGNLIQTIHQLHICLETTCQQDRFQIAFFNNTNHIQDVLQQIISHSLKTSSKVFYDELFHELSTNKHKYASFVLLCRVIESFDSCLSQQTSDLSVNLIHRLITHLYDLIDQCPTQVLLPALLPPSFQSTQSAYGSLYDITYSLVMRLFKHKPMQTTLSSMNRLIQSSSSITTSSIQLSCELIIQSWYLHTQCDEFQFLFGLFFAALFRFDIHTNFVNHLLTLPNMRTTKFYAYDAFLSLDSSNPVFDLFRLIKKENHKNPLIDSKNLSTTFPTNLEHLYVFVRLFNTELNSTQIQHTIDTCIYSLQQFISLPIITQSTCQHFILTLRVMSHLILNNQNEHFKSLISQLTQLILLLDEHKATDVRLELLNVFAVHSNIMEDDDLGRLLDFMLTSSISSSPNSVAFHIGCLNIVDSLKQRPSRSANITDLIIQLIVRYGNEQQCSQLLRAHLMRVFMSYATLGKDDSVSKRVKSQCLLLRSSIDEFEKSKTTMNRSPIENILQSIAANQSAMTTIVKNEEIFPDNVSQLDFYQAIVNELTFDKCSISTANSNAMQQD